MSGDDYTSSDDGFDAAKKFARPVFVRQLKKKAYAGSNKRESRPCETETPMKQPQQHHDQDAQGTTIRLVPVVMDHPKSRRNKKRKTTSTSTSNRGTVLFEFGESIAGYKCVTTESEISHLKQTRESESTDESASESEVDVFAFDRARDTEAKKVETEEQYARTIRQYWHRKTTESDDVVLPLPDTPTLAEASVDIISEHDVEQFYTMSSSLVGIDRLDLIRRDRIRWHPDKHRCHQAKVTKLFQVINGLWERLRRARA